ncbi:MAG: hypothetical protein ACYSWZ_00620 [Planctomycetota bacterium]|jgi:hypothetical protein
MKYHDTAPKPKWLYFNIHNLIGLRVERGHASERSVRLVFGPFETEALDHVDLTLQYDPPEIGQHSFASEVYVFTDEHVYIKNYKLHLIKQQDGFVLASKRDLLPFVMPIIQCLLLVKGHSFVHGAAVAVKGQGILLPGWGGTGKTSAIVCLLRDVPNSSFLSDDYTIVDSAGRLLSFPKAFFIYPYHRNLFPHLFTAIHKPLVPQFLSGILERVRTVVRPAIMAMPRLERLARRITPEHMQIPARIVLPEAEFVDAVPLRSILFLERYSGDRTWIDELSPGEVTSRLIGNWYYEQGQCARDLLLGAAGTAVMDFETYFSSMSSVINAALDGRKVYRLRIGKLTPTEAGKAIVDAVCEIVSTWR